MILTLEITGPEAGKLGPAQRKVFNATGGTIGRQPDNAWVLNDPYVSGHHAVIRFLNGQFYIEDTSTNGTFINSLDHRLRHGEPYALKPGDRIIIDPFDIRASFAGAAAEEIARPPTPPLPVDPFRPAAADPFRPAAAEPFGAPDPFRAPAVPSDPFRAPAVPSDPFADDPFDAPRQATPSSSSASPFGPLAGTLPDPISDPNLDPMAALFKDNDRIVPKDVPRAANLAGRSPIHDHYEPPPVILPTEPEPPAQAGGMIPDDWDKSQIIRAPGVPPPRPGPPVTRTPPPEARPSVPPSAPPSIPPRPRVAPPPAPAVTKPPAAAPAGPSPLAGASADVTLASVLAATGLENVSVTPELAQSFGEILRVVVSGVMDVLQARQRIKDEFRMRVTSFKRADNNPLKFSANVDDALHNLLVKRNAAYLGPVDAFEDAFEDLRNHQMAMLAGVRVAFEAMLAELDPDRLQEEFDRQLKKGGGLVPAKLRYWELYRDKVRDMVKDPDTNFREWFGEEFAKAYEEQLERLKAQRRGGSR